MGAEPGSLSDEQRLDWFERVAEHWQDVAERDARYAKMTPAQRKVADAQARLECAERASRYDFEEVARLRDEVSAGFLGAMKGILGAAR